MREGWDGSMSAFQREIGAEQIDVKKGNSKLVNKTEKITVCVGNTILGRCPIRPVSGSSRSLAEGNFDS